jgi:type VI secretion system protein VasJ
MATMSVDVLELGKHPISDAAPTGVPSRDDPAYEALQAEFRKLELPELPTVDWAGAVKLASDILGNKSKDVMAGVYLAMALFERDGYDGLATGMTVLSDMLSSYWDKLHPERVRPRQTAFQYLGDRGGKRVEMRGADGASRETVQRIIDLTDKVDGLLGEKLEGGAGLLSELQRQLRDVLGQTSAPAAPAAAASAPSAGAAPASFSAPSVSAPSSVGSEDDFDRTVQAVRPLLRSIGEWKRTQNPRDPMAYRLPRIATWIAVKQAPPSNGGKTSIPAPAADVLARLEGKLAAQQWAGILEETESRMASSVFWLDLHYFAYTALRGMGPEFNAASEGVAAEVRGLIQRLPELVDLTFDSGMPLGGDATRAWIKDTVMAAPGSGGGGRPSGGLALPAEMGEPEGLADAREQAAKLAGNAQLPDAVRLLETGAARAVRARERAAWKVAVARVCADAGRHDVALAQLEALQDDLHATTLEAWDPELASQMLRLLLAARQKAVPAGAASPEDQQKTRELLRRLARLDVAAALEFQRPAQ